MDCAIRVYVCVCVVNVQLTLVNNPIVKRQGYRLRMIKMLPSLKVLDFAKVKPVEREEAEALPDDAPDDAMDEVFDDGEMDGAAAGGRVDDAASVGLDKEGAHSTAIRAAIESAQTLEEVRALEESLANGAYHESQRGNGEQKADAMEED